jgi:hypothetical protein
VLVDPSAEQLRERVGYFLPDEVTGAEHRQLTVAQTPGRK